MYHKVNRKVIEDDKNRIVSLPGWTEENYTAFDIEETQHYSWISTGTGLSKKLQIHYELNMDAEVINRSVYNFMHALGDTGGINAILFSVASSLLSVFNLNKSENFLASKLYSTSHSPPATGPSDKQLLKPSGQSSICEWFQGHVPFGAKCCRKRNKDKLFEKARDLYASETDVVSIIQQLRLYKTISRKLIPPEELRKLT